MRPVAANQAAYDECVYCINVIWRLHLLHKWPLAILSTADAIEHATEHFGERRDVLRRIDGRLRISGGPARPGGALGRHAEHAALSLRRRTA